jgi:hypothetical protein
MTEYIDLKPGDLILVKEQELDTYTGCSRKRKTIIWLSVKSNLSVYATVSSSGEIFVSE